MLTQWKLPNLKQWLKSALFTELFAVPHLRLTTRCWKGKTNSIVQLLACKLTPAWSNIVPASELGQIVFKGSTNLIQIGDQWDFEKGRHVCHSQFQFLVETFCSSSCHSAKMVMGTAKHEQVKCVGGRKKNLPVGWIRDVNFELANLVATERIPKHFQQRLWGKLEGSPWGVLLSGQLALGYVRFIQIYWIDAHDSYVSRNVRIVVPFDVCKLSLNLRYERKNMRYKFVA